MSESFPISSESMVTQPDLAALQKRAVDVKHKLYSLSEEQRTLVIQKSGPKILAILSGLVTLDGLAMIMAGLTDMTQEPGVAMVGGAMVTIIGLYGAAQGMADLKKLNQRMDQNNKEEKSLKDQL